MNLPRFRLHLSTAIVLMFVLGGLVWANIKEIETASTTFPYPNCEMGWPLTFIKKIAVVGTDSHDVWYEHSLRRINFILDLIVCLVILTFTWAACETFIARRSKP